MELSLQLQQCIDNFMSVKKGNVVWGKISLKSNSQIYLFYSSYKLTNFKKQHKHQSPRRSLEQLNQLSEMKTDLIFFHFCTSKYQKYLLPKAPFFFFNFIAKIFVACKKKLHPSEKVNSNVARQSLLFSLRPKSQNNK